MTMRTVLPRGVLTLAGVCALMSCVTADDDGPQQVAGMDWDALRGRMVESQIRARGVTDARVLAAIRKVPRHLFVPESDRGRAYDDTPLPIGHAQTISQPYIVGYMTDVLELRPTDRVLEIGAGSGYQAAVLGEIVREVYTIEIVEPLAVGARETLAGLGYANIHVRHGNGYLGWPEAAPFDRIIVTAAPDQVPAALIDQLAMGGLMVVPVGRGEQMMTILRKTDRGVVTTETLPVRFVPMVGKPE